VINVITRVPEPVQRLEVGGGTFGGARISFDGSLPSSALTVGGGFDRTSGFRAHSARSSTRARMRYALIDKSDTRLDLTARGHWRSFDEPGPLLESLMSADRAASDPIFRFDQTTDEGQVLTLAGDRRLGRLARLSGSIGGERRRTDAVRTLALAPDFGDTKLRKASVLRAAADFQVDVGDTRLPGTESIVLGGGLSHGRLDSRYHDVAAGPGVAYGAASGEPGPENARGDGKRTIGSVHAQYTLLPTSALRLSAGGRLDALRDAFRPSAPASVEDANATHTAFSPRIGANLRYLNDPRNSGNAYVTVSRSFKAPTLDQLYDLRAIPIPFDPFEIRTSNPDLEPQTGTNVEAGLYHSLLVGDAVRAGASISGYEMQMKNELDFDVASFRYVNIGRSRHRGLEVGANVDARRSSLFASYALQDVISRSGDNAGKHLKAIPRHTLTAGGSASLTRSLSVSLLAANMRGMFIDDANSASIPDYTRVDARVSFAVRGVDVFADARNLLDAKYSSSGFLDPAGSGQAYYYPAAGRMVGIGIRIGRLAN
jgi:outer membrane receptor protein involved in Fe transport